ncbi:MAG: hypothetical protein EOO51_13920 [Flavobacterium sp.]|nr:MAG: hypothetical protein EOO51_13920 [Flavobacterium sp.]
MSIPRNLLAGLGGAIALNILHESLKKKSKNMPRVDRLGEEAVQKALNAAGTGIEDEANLYLATLASDVISNGLYYSAIGYGNPKYTWIKAIALGITGGAGAIGLPGPLGLDPTPVTKSNTTKSLTIGYYLFGALVTAAILKSMEKQGRRTGSR